MTASTDQLRVGFLEPHLECCGGIRRMLELANRLHHRGHEVRIYVPDDVDTECSWMAVAPRVSHVSQGLDDDLDIIVFNHEPQWHLVPRFTRAWASVFYALHYGALYGKPGSWESVRAPVDLRLANSHWTAECITAEIGQQPTVVLGGVNSDIFYPIPSAKKQYPILCVGDDRAWKGTETVRSAAELLGLPLATYADKGLSQRQLAAEYAKAEVFVVGSHYEGFGQPGLEALACGVPLVTTDNGGCREYAISEETALVVPPKEPESMAEAIRRLREDDELRHRLAANGLELVRQRFDWETSAQLLEERLSDAVQSSTRWVHERSGWERPAPESAILSIVVLQWGQLKYTQRCVESIRRNTDVDYELIVVDNGSHWEAANYVEHAADAAILNPVNRGFGEGMNQGLEAAQGRYVAFLNNDTVLPPAWASSMVAHLTDGSVGIAVPAITNARDQRIVRSEPGDDVERLLPFEAPPPAVAYVMQRSVIEGLRGWGREYEIASGEDMDLCFKVWANGLDVLFDTRVLVEHVSKGTARQLPDWRGLWSRNRQVFLAKWTSASPNVPRLEWISPERFADNLRHARAAAGWMGRYFDASRRLSEAESRLRDAGRGARDAADSVDVVSGGRSHVRDVMLWAWRRAVRPWLPARWRGALFHKYKHMYYQWFPQRKPQRGSDQVHQSEREVSGKP